MADSTKQKIVSFLVENRPLECKVCKTTVAFQNKKTEEVIGAGLSCECLVQVIADTLLPPDLGKEPKEAALNKGEDHVDRGNGKGDIKKQQELEELIKERKLQEEANLKNAREQEARKKEREEEASRKLQEQERALKKQREEEEALRKQKMEEEASRKLKEEEARKKLREEEEALRKLKEEQARKKLQEEEAREREKVRQKLAAEKETADMAKVGSNMDLSPKTWTGMKYSPNLKSGAIVHIVFPWTPIDFQVVCDDDNELLEHLQEDLMKRVTSAKLKQINGKLQRDDVVIAEYEGAFYRARVTHASSNQCKLSFIDYGDKTIKKYDELYEIPEDLYKAPIYGLKVRLDGLDPKDFSVGALLCDTIEPSLYEAAYSLELMQKMDMNDMHTCGILRDVSSGQSLNDVVKKILQNF